VTRLAATLLLLLAISWPRLEAQQLAGDPSRLTLFPGDVIRIDVWQQKEYGCECLIAADGSIVHPLYRELRVTGLPLTEVENKLRVFLSRYLSNPTFDIQALLRVIVAGEVRTPNIYTVPPGTSVAQVIAMAGGPTDRGKLEDVRLIRNAGSQRLDLTRPDATASRVEVHSGDEILIGRRRSVMQDVIAPSSSILAALAAVTGVIIQLNNRR
jgi:protein involved in polysaccharide export with SLBB domain